MTAHQKVAETVVYWRVRNGRKVNQLRYFVALAPEFAADAKAANAEFQDDLDVYAAACASGTAVIVSEPKGAAK